MGRRSKQSTSDNAKSVSSAATTRRNSATSSGGWSSGANHSGTRLTPLPSGINGTSTSSTSLSRSTCVLPTPTANAFGYNQGVFAASPARSPTTNRGVGPMPMAGSPQAVTFFAPQQPFPLQPAASPMAYSSAAQNGFLYASPQMAMMQGGGMPMPMQGYGMNLASPQRVPASPQAASPQATAGTTSTLTRRNSMVRINEIPCDVTKNPVLPTNVAQPAAAAPVTAVSPARMAAPSNPPPFAVGSRMPIVGLGLALPPCTPMQAVALHRLPVLPPVYYAGGVLNPPPFPFPIPAELLGSMSHHLASSAAPAPMMAAAPPMASSPQCIGNAVPGGGGLLQRKSSYARTGTLEKPVAATSPSAAGGAAPPPPTTSILNRVSSFKKTKPMGQAEPPKESRKKDPAQELPSPPPGITGAFQHPQQSEALPVDPAPVRVQSRVRSNTFSGVSANTAPRVSPPSSGGPVRHVEDILDPTQLPRARQLVTVAVEKVEVEDNTEEAEGDKNRENVSASRATCASTGVTDERPLAESSPQSSSLVYSCSTSHASQQSRQPSPLPDVSLSLVPDAEGTAAGGCQASESTVSPSTNSISGASDRSGPKTSPPRGRRAKVKTSPSTLPPLSTLDKTPPAPARSPSPLLYSPYYDALEAEAEEGEGDSTVSRTKTTVSSEGTVGTTSMRSVRLGRASSTTVPKENSRTNRLRGASQRGTGNPSRQEANTTLARKPSSMVTAIPDNETGLSSTAPQRKAGTARGGGGVKTVKAAAPTTAANATGAAANGRRHKVHRAGTLILYEMALRARRGTAKQGEEEGSKSQQYPVKTYGRNCTDVRVTTSDGEEHPFHVDELVAHRKASTALQSKLMNRVRSVFLGGRSAAVVSLDGPKPASSAAPFESPSWFALQRLLLDVVKDIEEKRAGTGGGDVYKPPSEAGEREPWAHMACSFALVKKTKSAATQGEGKTTTGNDVETSEMVDLLQKEEEGAKAVPVRLSTNPLCGTRLSGITYRVMSEEKDFTSALTTAQQQAATVLDQLEKRAEGSDADATTAKAERASVSLVVTCVLTVRTGTTPTTLSCEDVEEEMAAMGGKNSKLVESDEEDEGRLLEPLRDRNALVKLSSVDGAAGGATTADAAAALSDSDVVMSCLTCIGVDQHFGAITSALGPPASVAARESTSSGTSKTGTQSANSAAPSDACSALPLFTEVLTGSCFTAIVLGIEPSDAESLAALEAQYKLSRSLHGWARNGSARRYAAKAAYRMRVTRCALDEVTAISSQDPEGAQRQRAALEEELKEYTTGVEQLRALLPQVKEHRLSFF